MISIHNIHLGFLKHIILFQVLPTRISDYLHCLDMNTDISLSVLPYGSFWLLVILHGFVSDDIYAAGHASFHRNTVANSLSLICRHETCRSIIEGSVFCEGTVGCRGFYYNSETPLCRVCTCADHSTQRSFYPPDLIFLQSWQEFIPGDLI